MKIANNLDEENALFWSELCGTGLANSLGIQDFSAESLRRFDQAYMDFYPYLPFYLDLKNLKQKTILEIGLGYGTVGQILAENAGSYYGADISPGPVAMINRRLQMIQKPSQGEVMSAHQLKFSDEMFDSVYSIGCFHHTGDVQKCIDEAYRVLKPGGRLMFMVYNKNSYRRFLLMLKMFHGHLLTKQGAAKYDVNSKGDAAPHTELYSRAEIKKMCKNFCDIHIRKENFRFPYLSHIPFFSSWGQKNWGLLGRLCGLDLYVSCVK